MSKRNTMPKNQLIDEQCFACQECIEEDNEPLLLFKFDELRILGVFQDDIHLQGALLDDEGHNECVLVIKNKLFKSLLNKWLKRKKSLCELWEEYCGVGSVYVEEYQPCGEVYLNMLNDNVDVDSPYLLIPLTVPMFRVTKCSVDIEHG